ncbi:MAG: glycosyltransferase [Minisyncoccia bacterium]
MFHKITLSVILPVFKEKDEYVQESIKSVLNQTFKKFELLIVIDTGKDDAEFLRVYNAVKNCLNNDDRARLIINEKNLGLPQSLNKAISLAEGEFIARMDADDIALLHRFETQLNYMKQNPQIDLVGSKVIFINPQNQILNESKSLTKETIIKKLCAGISPIPHPTWFFRKSFITKLNYYRPQFQTVEDYELLARAVLNGCQIGFINEPLLKYRVEYRRGRISVQRPMQLKLTFLIADNLRKNKEVSEVDLKKVLNGKINFFAKFLDYLSQYLENIIIKFSPKLHNYFKWLIYLISPYKARHIIEIIYYLYIK